MANAAISAPKDHFLFEDIRQRKLKDVRQQILFQAFLYVLEHLAQDNLKIKPLNIQILKLLFFIQILCLE